MNKEIPLTTPFDRAVPIYDRGGLSAEEIETIPIKDPLGLFDEPGDLVGFMIYPEHVNVGTYVAALLFCVNCKVKGARGMGVSCTGLSLEGEDPLPRPAVMDVKSGIGARNAIMKAECLDAQGL